MYNVAHIVSSVSRVTSLLARTLHQVEVPTQRQAPNSRAQKDRQGERIHERLRSWGEAFNLLHDTDIR